MDPLLIYNGSEGEEVYYTVRRVKFTETVTEIPEEAFSQCSMLFRVELNKGLKTIGRCAFDRCISLKYINFPSTIVTIEASAFNGCKSLESLLNLPDLEAILPYTFSNCESLVEVSIPPSVTKIEKAAFSGCTNLESIKFHQEGRLTVIGATAFYRCDSLKSLSVPSSVKKIESYAFEGCRNLISIELSEGLEEIGHEVFAGCDELRNLFVPNTVTKLGRMFKKLQYREPPRCLTKAVFPKDDDGGDEDCNLLIINALKTRFDGLPIHELCYFQSHYPTGKSTLNSKLRKAGLNNNRFTSFFSSIFGGETKAGSGTSHIHHDVFGMTPFHILALSANPSIYLFQVLLRHYSTTTTKALLLSKDLSGNSCLDYMLMNKDPDSGPMIKVTVQVIITERIKWLGLKRWRDVALRDTENLTEEGWDGGVENRQRQLDRIYSTISKFERLEILSLLEIYLWKMEIKNNITSSGWRKQRMTASTTEESLSVRQISRVNCGASIVIPNVLSFLN